MTAVSGAPNALRTDTQDVVRNAAGETHTALASSSKRTRFGRVFIKHLLAECNAANERAEQAETVLAERDEAKALLEQLRSPEITNYDSQQLARWISKAIGHGMEAAKLRAELATASEERDLAIGHDRQPYPTAWAYDQACAALNQHRERADRAEQKLAELRERIGEEGEEWSVLHVSGRDAPLSEAVARQFASRAKLAGAPSRAERRVVGEWKAAGDAS